MSDVSCPTSRVLARVVLALLLAGICPDAEAHNVGDAILWNREISRIFYRRCASCHRDGGTSFTCDVSVCKTGYLRDGAQETLKGLSEHYCLGVVTNGYADAQRGRLKASGLLSRFDVVLISEEAGYTKPDGRIFECAMRELGVVPAETLFVGDSVEHDYYGALNAGIDFCYYRTSKDSTISQYDRRLR